jgi:Tfp pilus assembly protein PilV
MRIVRRHSDRRRGLVMFAVLVCLVLIAMISGVLLKVAAAQRETLRIEERRLQAEWLVESGLERAVARLSQSADYKGETWELSADDLGGPAPGLVKIEVKTIESQPTRRRVRVQADYPRGADRRARQSKELTVGISPPNPGESP